MCLIFPDGFWAVHIAFVRTAKFKFLAQVPVDYLPHPVFSRLVIYWPSARANMPFQSDAPEWSDKFQWPVIERNRVGGLADEMGQGKSPLYTHKLMNQKRVTSELHDSYFRLMTIKHAIPKIECAIEWALNYYITRSRKEVRQWGGQRRWRQDVVGKATPGRKGPSGSPMEFWRPVGDKMQ